MACLRPKCFEEDFKALSTALNSKVEAHACRGAGRASASRTGAPPGRGASAAGVGEGSTAVDGAPAEANDNDSDEEWHSSDGEVDPIASNDGLTPLGEPAARLPEP